VTHLFPLEVDVGAEGKRGGDNSSVFDPLLSRSATARARGVPLEASEVVAPSLAKGDTRRPVELVAAGVGKRLHKRHAGRREVGDVALVLVEPVDVLRDFDRADLRVGAGGWGGERRRGEGESWEEGGEEHDGRR
jgi:hypothetical protein